MLVRVAYYGTLFAAAVIALVILGVPVGAILSISSVALVVLVVALRESLENFAAAVIFVIYQPFRVGEEIETLGRKGIVMEMQLFNTVLRQSDRSLAVLSNGDIQKEGLVNYSRFGISRVDLPFTLTYDDDIDKARSIIMDLMTSDPQVLKDPPPVVVPVRMGENGLEMQARPFVRCEDGGAVQVRLLQLIIEQLSKAGIEPAVAQHDVRMLVDD
jgi:small conductance mechanosensitive channel